MLNRLKDIPLIRRELAKAWRSGYNAACRDSDKIDEWIIDGPGFGGMPTETRNPYGDI